jgi:tetratricopeptide (TPR) repeat protein
VLELETAIRAYARYVNSWRIRGDFVAVRKHVESLDEMTRDPVGKSLAEARWLLGTALVDLEEWDRADAALLDAIREYRRIGKRFEVKRVRITRVMLWRASGKAPRRYLSAARRVFKSFTEEDQLRQPSLFAGHRMNVLLYMVEASEVLQAEKLWRSILPTDQGPFEARRIGVGAIIDFSMGRSESAENGFREASRRCHDMSMPDGAALFLLYLADLLLATGRICEGEESLLHALKLFEECQLKRHVAQALDRLREALRLKEGLRTAIALAIARTSGIVRRYGEGPVD